MQNPFQVFRGVNSIALKVGDSSFYSETILDPTQLFERFCPFQGRHRKFGYLPEYFTPVGI
jgi:hypothetical protein